MVLDMLSTAAAMDAADSTSSVRTVTFGAAAREGEILEGVRAVAKTWYPFSWKAWASPSPMPPAEQPVKTLEIWDLLLDFFYFGYKHMNDI